jgi:hypothetical protein
VSDDRTNQLGAQAHPIVERVADAELVKHLVAGVAIVAFDRRGVSDPPPKMTTGSIVLIQRDRFRPGSTAPCRAAARRRSGPGPLRSAPRPAFPAPPSRSDTSGRP